LPGCSCGALIRPHICWFGETPFDLDRIFDALRQCTVFLAIGTSGTVEPAASFVSQVAARARTFYVGPEAPANSAIFDDCILGKSGELLAALFTLG
jgi:NAD-dependent deacetylase